MSQKQKETLEWLDELEQYAKERQLPTRILDSIAECRKSAASENVNWSQIGLQIEELLDSIEQKVLPAVAQVEEGDNEVSVEAVENELKKMALRCHAENETSVNNFENRKNIILQNFFINLQDITRVKAHLKEMKNEDSYQIFFQRASIEYRNNVLVMVRQLLQDIRNNHGQMMNRMKSMMRSIKAYKHGLGSERLYGEYDTKAAGLDNKIQNVIEKLGTGEEEILNFAHKTRESINPIVRKLEKKRKKMAWLPAVVIMCIFLTGAVAVYFAISNVIKEAEESVAKANGTQIEDMLENRAEELKKINEFVESMESTVPDGSAATAGSIGSFVIVIFIFLVVALIYGLYLLLLKQWCNRQICNKCGVYLKDELADFAKNNTLLSQMSDMINAAMEEYERQYAIMLNELLAGSRFDPESTEKKEAHRFTDIKNSWNTIKYM